MNSNFVFTSRTSSLVLLWSFTFFGVIGILSPYEHWFLVLTPLNLLMYFVVVLWNIERFKKTYFIPLLIPFVIGFIVEALGVNFGWIFGDYTYGKNLGQKILGVPIMICINWLVLTACTSQLAKSFTSNYWLSCFIGALMMTVLDVIIEVSAPRFDFWEFKGGEVPFQNYIGWLITAFLAHLAYQKFNVPTNKIVSIHVMLAITIFFSVFLIFR